MEKLIIDRKTWARGDTSSLLTHEGTYCCLGFECKRAGLSDGDIFDISTPQGIEFADSIQKIKHLLDAHHNDTELVGDLICINDASIGFRVGFSNEKVVILRSEEQRERLIKEGFARMDIEVEFIN